MNNRQLSEHIGNIDDRVIKQAEQIPDYAAMHRKKRWRNIFTGVAVLVLMLSSFSVGAIAFAHENIVKVPVEKEIVELEGTNLSLTLPDSWAERYSVEKRGNNFIVYVPQIRNGKSDFEGILFTIVCYENSMTEEQFIEAGLDFTAYRYILATSNKTYILHYASDVQYDPADEKMENSYQEMMSEIKDIQFTVNDLFQNN